MQLIHSFVLSLPYRWTVWIAPLVCRFPGFIGIQLSIVRMVLHTSACDYGQQKDATLSIFRRTNTWHMPFVGFVARWHQIWLSKHLNDRIRSG